MKALEILSYTLRENFLDIVVEKRNLPIETIEIISVNRESKEEKRIIPRIELKNDDAIIIKLDLETVNYDNKYKNIIDFYLAIEDKKINLTNKTVDLKTRINKYLPTFYKLSSNRVAVPYLTKKNGLALLYGDAAEIFNSFCEEVYDKTTLNDLNVQHNEIVASFKENIFYSEIPMFVILQNSKTQKNEAIQFDVINVNPLILKFDLENIRDLNVGVRYNFYLLTKTGNIVKKYRVGLNLPNNIEKPERYFQAVEVNKTKKVVPYVTSKGELTFLVGNDLTIDKELYTIDHDVLYINHFVLQQKKLKIYLNENNDTNCYTNYSIVIKNNKNSEMITLNEAEASFDQSKNEINIDLGKSFDCDLFKQNQRWFLYVKFYQEESVIISQVKKEGEWVESPLQRHSKPIVINQDLSLITYISGKNELAFLCGDDTIYKREVYKKIEGFTTINNFEVSGNDIKFEISNLPYYKDHQITLLLKNRKTKQEWRKELEYQYKEEIIYVNANLNSFVNEFKTVTSRWDLFLEVTGGDIIEINKLGYFSSPVKPAYERFFDCIYTDTANAVTPYLTTKNELSIVIRPEIGLFSEKIKADMSLTKFKMKGHVISGEVNLKLFECNSFDATSVMLKYRDKIEVKEYKFQANETKKNNDQSTISFSIDLLPLELENYYWDMYVIIKINGTEYPIKIKNPTKKVKESIDKKVIRYSYTLENGFLVYPYITSVNTLAIGYKEKEKHEASLYKVKENLAYFTYRLFKKYFDRKGIWLAYEKFSEGAQDNGYYFFKYCYENNKKENFYYIIKKDSPDYTNLKYMENRVLKFMSFKYMLYMYASELLVSSESKGHSYDIRIEKGRLKKTLKQKKQVFLQHGVTALKRVDYVFNKNTSHAVDLFVATSDYEKSIIKNYFGYSNEEIITTGFCRWDVLEDKSGEEKVIFLMPTWRTWMDDLSEDKFIETEYYKKYIGFLNSKELNTLLDNSNIKLQFYIHPKFKSYIDKFKASSNNVKIYQYGEEKVNELLMKSSMLITDYSSVAWEMFYMKKPVVFYQFDIDDYNNFQGSYLNMETDLFGDRVFDVKQLVNIIKEYNQRNFKEKEEFGKLRSKYFKYVDKNNSKRTFKAIMDKKKQLKLKGE
ncbi:CDP-glycerol glycerophosphotransferase family protein [Peribacillus sp. TH16]|uniref:CDP-glycerol glycerophosphotransferase family protein n=1 Tax=Peribacillus sp. TH16 TaxID=2798482 RepID=UPI0031456755